jgi:AraC-like DNA-binding protein
MTLASKPVLADVSRATERHYSVAELAELWNLSPSAVRRLFQREPGVLTIGEPRPKYGRRRGKVTLRIPQSVLERVYRRQCVGG